MKVLYLNNYDSSFLHNQFLDLKRIGNLKIHFCIHVSWWRYYRKFKCKPDRVFSSSQKDSLSSDEITLITYPNLPMSITEEWDSYFIYRKLIKKYKKGNFDLIHAQNGYPSGHAAYLLSKKWGTPYIVTSHGMDAYRCYTNSVELGGQQQFKNKSIIHYKEAMKHAKFVTGVSVEFAKFVNDIEPSANVVSTPNSYKFEIFKVLENKPTKESQGLKENDFVILATGFFIKRKGHIDILKAVAKLSNKANVKIVIIGGGPLKEDLLESARKLGIKDNLKLIGYIKQNKLVEWYNCADLFIFPSLQEPFGLGLLEAMACGIPALATKTWGPLEIIEEGVNGYLVDKSSPDQIADKIEELRLNPEKLKQMGLQAAKLAYDKYSTKNQDVYELYKKAVK